VAQEVIALCCNPLSECADDGGCSSHTPYNVQECCEHCQSTYETCYNYMNTESGGPLSLTYSFVAHDASVLFCFIHVLLISLHRD
jgi:hypothetical protein